MHMAGSMPTLSAPLHAQVSGSWLACATFEKAVCNLIGVAPLMAAHTAVADPGLCLSLGVGTIFAR